MDKIDRLGWAAGITFVSYGVPVGIRVNRPEMLEQLLDRFPPGWKPSRARVVERLYSLIVGGVGARPGIRRFNILYGNTQKLLRTLDIDEIPNCVRVRFETPRCGWRTTKSLRACGRSGLEGTGDSDTWAKL